MTLRATSKQSITPSCSGPRLGVFLWASVVALHRRRGPSHITGLVVAVVVDAIKGQIRSRSTTNVSDKRREGSLPGVADANAARPVVLELRIIRLGASRSHLAPDRVFGPSRSAVLRECLSDTLPLETSARARRVSIFTPQRRSSDPSFDAAGASTEILDLNPRATLTSKRPIDHGPHSECRPDSDWAMHPAYFTSKAAA